MNRALRFAVVAACCLSSAGVSAAATPAAGLDYRPIPGVWTQPEPARGSDDPEELETFIDEAMRGLLEGSDVPGAAIAVVKVNGRVDGSPIVVAKGYGLADRDKETPVDPDRTMFRLGSISKLFTWTAVMQLVEQNRLDLLADVNTYLEDFKIPATYPQPVTLKNLMTHTAGFEANSYGYTAARHWCCLSSLADTMAHHLPARVQPPATDFTRGADALYTNFAAALAGHIVAQRSRQQFEEYIEQHIFGPLEMEHSTFREPVPLRLRSDASRGYVVSVPAEGEAEYREPGFEYFHAVGPAASASASAADMAHFMLAHLQLGRYGDRRILKEDTARLMHGRVFSPHPQSNGLGLGFVERHINGRRALWHPGATIQFDAELYLLPEENVGVFVAYNSEPPVEVAGQLMRQFMDHYFPSVLPDLKPYGDAAARAIPYAGTYGPRVRSHTTWEKRNALDTTFEVSATACGLRIADDPVAGEVSEWIELSQAPGVFRRENSEDTIAFSQDADGKTYLLGRDAFAPMVKLRLHETPQFDRWLLRACLLGFIPAILLAALWRGRAPTYRLARRLTAAVGLVDLAILAGVERTSNWDTYDLMVALPWPLMAAMTLSLVSVLLTLGLTLVVADGWRRPDWTLRGRLWHTALALPAAAFLWWLHYWNLIGFQAA